MSSTPSKSEAAATAETTAVNTLGHVRLRHEVTNEIILIPTPSNDPRDPLNWPRGFKLYTAGAVCFAMIMCNFLAAGPTLAILETAQDFFPNWQETGMAGPIAKTAYFFNCTALFQGLGNLVWMPLTNKYGRRAVYVISFTMYLITAIWCAVAKEYANFLVARIVMGFAAGAAECLAPITIADIFFLHERGTITALYNASLNLGVVLGAIIDGFIVRDHPWRYIYYVAIALIGALTLIVYFTFPETAYNRSPDSHGITTTLHAESEAYHHKADEESNTEHLESARPQAKMSDFLVPGLKLYHGTFTEESLWNMTIRPVMLLALPPVFWATMVMSVTIGFITAITSNVSPAFSTAYGFEAWQSGLCFFAGVIGALLGILLGGNLSDWVADYFTRRNGGIREPEMRLPAIMISLITGPLSLALYGVGIEKGMHWIVPTIGIGLINFTITQATNVSLVYTIDSYRPIAGEIVVTQLAFKSAFGFLLGFYTNPWVDKSGYAVAYGEMAAICGGVLIFWIPLFLWGKKLRQKTISWRIMKFVRWDVDREVGE
ncbi:major facilitator superfamily domain-containing protein [Dactylonectria macrodidyma]|uniref:Major facilitator superfamily domain-containing protein n=1 Tax=Dactylonectria macrodidyma TaxID=307937 RepID=A0A9P9EQ07_9HYPO|nr:major facilitator superfamily domain-containing protein [Dactylonectria macrodidyma]